MKPTDDSTVSDKTAVWFRVSAARTVKRASVSIDGTVVGSFNYPGNKTDITDVRPVDLRNLTGKIHTITILAIDKE